MKYMRAHLKAKNQQTEVIDTGNFSFTNGRPAKGCEYCVKGQKLVLFITGLCGMRCFYCPVSEKKIFKDVIYANEWKIEKKEDLLEEARLTEAKGAGITGGDPLVVVDRVCEYIRLLKKEFGTHFHIHLYTTLQLVNEERLEKLHDAGLDEIRFHFNLDDNTWWPRIMIAQKYNWDIGAEIPCIPGKKKEILALTEYLKDKVQFFNLNELELSERNSEEFKKRILVTRNTGTYAIKKSYELAQEILRETREHPYTVYFCTAKLKDCVQMKNRIKRRARNVRKPFDKVTSEGMLIRGALYLKDLEPSFGYRRKLESVNRAEYRARLENIREELITNKIFDKDSICVDDVKLRLIVDQQRMKKHIAELKKRELIPARVEEYPTRDAIEIEIEYL